MSYEPLAETLRPTCLEEVVGQEHLFLPGSLLKTALDQERPLSIILWGPPGCGKTTIARLYAQAFQARFVTFSAVLSGIADLRKVIEETQSAPLFYRHTILFVDEIHRFNKAQQDGFLPHVERGTIVLVGATTENPSFSLNDALLSRMRVLQLHSLEEEALEKILQRFETLRYPLPLTPAQRAQLLSLAGGDGRYLLNLVEVIPQEGPVDLEKLLQHKAPLFDKKGEGHYNLISALHKAIRSSDPDASLYWLARLLEGGENPLFVARRLIRAASEDVGLADPQALTQALAAQSVYQTLGSPEGDLALAQATLYLALAPKSNAAYVAYQKAQESAKQTAHLPPPLNILNAPTKLMKSLGYGKAYAYDHDMPNGYSGQNCWPKDIKESFYHPVERGFEREMQKRMAYFKKLRIPQ
ncbi:MAG: replication-associated recombination protein A [Verrucomicrobia bacterium]|nr:replication-associated recombination protein A [Verrucomicrobiota bacterium]